MAAFCFFPNKRSEGYRSRQTRDMKGVDPDGRESGRELEE